MGYIALIVSALVTIIIFIVSFITISKGYGYKYMIEKQQKPTS